MHRRPVIRAIAALCVMWATHLGIMAQRPVRLVDAVDGSSIPGGMLRGSNGAPMPCDDQGSCPRQVVTDGVIRIEAPGYTSRSIELYQWQLADTVRLWPIRVDLPVLEVAQRLGDQEREFASVTDLEGTLMASTERSGLRSTALWVPGVQWDQRGFGGSQRLGIRGGILRAPFGVRGVKVYWGPFPLTLADGSTPLELLDPQLVGRLRVVRSVGSPAFGLAPGGMLLADPPTAEGRTVAVEGEAMGGPDGYYRSALSAHLAAEDQRLSVGALRQGNDGYRAQEWSHRDQAWLVMRRANARGSTLVQATWQDARWALPGSVDSLTAATDPRAARPYSQLLNAHVDKRQWMAGIAQELHLGRAWRATIAVHGQGIEKVNPYGTSAANNGWKEESIAAGGTRLLVSGELGKNGRVRWDAGLEGLIQRDALREYPYAEAALGPVRVDAIHRVSTLDGYAQARIRASPGTLLLLGFGVRASNYDQEDRLLWERTHGSVPGTPFPMAGISQRLGAAWTAHLRYAESADVPTLWELIDARGGFNTRLRAALVRECEGGITYLPVRGPFTVDLRMYRRWTDGLIVPAPPNDSTMLFVNAGRARQDGLEGWARWEAEAGQRWRPSLLASLSWQNGWLWQGGQQHAVLLPGEPPLRLGLLAGVSHWRGPHVQLGFRHTSAMAASTFTGEKLPGFQWMHARAGYTIQRPRWSMDLFVHVDNVLNTRYTAFVQVNDPGRRYYNPAPGRGLFAGAVLRWG